MDPPIAPPPEDMIAVPPSLIEVIEDPANILMLGPLNDSLLPATTDMSPARSKLFPVEMVISPERSALPVSIAIEPLYEFDDPVSIVTLAPSPLLV